MLKDAHDAEMDGAAAEALPVEMTSIDLTSGVCNQGVVSVVLA
ncbi:hypothetical protein [Pseudofrankia asymbiotica]|nr:hypothetical protein [Pseudofrankia asymbiotica]